MIEGSSYYLYYYTGCQSKLIKEDDGFKLNAGIESGYKHKLGMDMPIVAYGHAGYPMLFFPTAAADYLEYERFQMIDAIAHHIERGRVRVYSINSVNRYALLNENASPQWKAEMLTRYD